MSQSVSSKGISVQSQRKDVLERAIAGSAAHAKKVQGVSVAAASPAPELLRHHILSKHGDRALQRVSGRASKGQMLPRNRLWDAVAFDTFLHHTFGLWQLCLGLKPIRFREGDFPMTTHSTRVAISQSRATKSCLSKQC